MLETFNKNMKVYHHHRQFVQKMESKTDKIKRNNLVNDQLY